MPEISIITPVYQAEKFLKNVWIPFSPSLLRTGSCFL